MKSTGLFVNKLTTIDSTYLCSHRGLVGETWLLDINLTGELNTEGMLFDFSLVKSTIKATVDALLDHKLIVPTASWLHLSKSEERTDVTAAISGDQVETMLQYRAPVQAIEQITADTVTCETLKDYLTEKIAAVLPENVQPPKLHIYNQSINGDFYHYTHGLKKHKGNCQRLIHGHRSAFEIFIDGKRSEKEEKLLAALWQDITLITEEDILHRYTLEDVEYLCIGYHAPQGYFEMVLPAHRAYLINTDTTVELIAEHLAQCMKAKYPKSAIQVIAYEGFEKGAVANISSERLEAGQLKVCQHKLLSFQ